MIILAAVILVFGMISISSAVSPASSSEVSLFELAKLANTEYSSLQLVYFGAGAVIIAVLLFIDYSNIGEFSEIIYWVSVALLAAVALFGSEINGTAGWFKIAGRGFQPAEFCKIAIIIVIAKETAKVTQDKETGLDTVKEIWPMLWRFMIPFVLIMIQPDWGSAFVYFFITAGIMFMGRLGWKKILVFLLLIAVIVPLLWFFVMDDWQKARIEVFLYPELDPMGNGLQSMRARSVIEAGGLLGKGFFSPDLLTQQSNYLPEEHTDFIFASMVESCGFIGGLILILLYVFLILRIFRLAIRAKDDFGMYISCGVGFMLIFHIVENIGMNIGLLPITGVPLPLFSYGGSNMITTMAGLGLVMGVDLRRQSWDLL